MRAFYNTCVADPWIQVAQKLRDENSWEPVYWNGYHDDNSRNLVPEAFPDIIYHPYHFGWKGIYPEAVQHRYAEGALDLDFLNSIASEELLALRMMDRMDFDRYSFNTMERQRHFRNMLRYWSACLDWLKPDLVISSVVPHRVFDYALYLLCRYRNIPFLTFRESAFPGRWIPVTDIRSIGNILTEGYAQQRQSDLSANELKSTLPEDMLERYQKVLADYNTAEPDYMKRHVTSHKKSAGVVGLTKKFIADLRDGRELYLGEEGFIKKGMSYLKVRDAAPEDSRMSILKYAQLKIKNNRYKKELRAHYDSLVTEPDWHKPYVILNLHYQPEMTSNPSGGIFADQALSVDLLSRYLPADWLIYVKEHRSQFYAHTEGHTSRLKTFYDDLVKFPQVRLLPMSTDPFVSIKNARAVATITGTTGWEGMVMGKPVVIFGLAWYEKYKGVLRITDESSAEKLADFIEQFQFNEKGLMAYLSAFAQVSMRAYAGRGQKARIPMDENECINNITNTLTTMFHDARA